MTFVAAALIAVAAALASAAPAGSVTTERMGIHYPSSFAAIGDSWTAPSVTADSWATGTKRTVDSQYLRILAHNPAIRGHAYNLAEAHAATGPGVSDFAFQARGAIARHVDYIEIALGENDVCGETSKSAFAREFKAGLSHLTRALPKAHVFVLSIENVANHWRAINASPAGHRALTSGSSLDCLLGGSATHRQLTRVAKKIAGYNHILSKICRSTARCRYDNGAVYRMRFAARDFDPYQLQELSPAGERALSATAWHTGYRFTRG
jgi:lysophospholipase L1-like esterase